MAVRDDLVGADALTQGNNEIIFVTVAPTSATENLSGVSSLLVVFKPDTCTPDSSPYALVLTSGDPSQVTIQTHTADLITAEVYVPGTYLAEPYDRVWRVDAVSGSSGGRTAIYGRVEVTDL